MSRLPQLHDQGVSVWIDDLTRRRLDDGSLADQVARGDIRGLTTNPAIFAKALADGEAYDAQLQELAAAGAGVEDAVLALTADDVRRACDLFVPVFSESAGEDGRVSLEVDPRLAHETNRTIETARLLWKTVDRPNLMVKIPATVPGLPAITQAISEGISVNVTLIFSLDRYRAVMNAYLDGLEAAQAAGVDLSTIRSVASFFLSRLDTAVDARLDDLADDSAAALKGKAAVANARLAYEAYEAVFSGPRWEALSEAGAHPQRPLWASTGVKNPDYPDTKYVDELLAPGVVSTMPPATIEAAADHARLELGPFPGSASYAEAQEVFDELERRGISYDDVTEQLEDEGVTAFVESWSELLHIISDALRENDPKGKASA
ncbi:transaldolase [Bogoriella caseilytica]|uniref:Transaldolase n=1 Tax=Bogoriella caseilytica TaxID=56055 RepID=A0A3N2BGJ2_9MICO|nr:transaldolase [Bogoriella caseilytica]ROR74338.1 transaldolase [Bogoriella caseilytica]